MRSFSRVTTTPPSTQIYALIAKLSNNFTIFLTPCHFFAPENKKGCQLYQSATFCIYIPSLGEKDYERTWAPALFSNWRWRLAIVFSMVFSLRV